MERNMKKLKLYHGSTEIIDSPSLNKGKRNNDYGLGFYCTKNIELASEWACKMSGTAGYVNEYAIETSDLKVLDLTNSKYSILHWITLLLQHRTFALHNPVSTQAKDYLVKNFSIDLNLYDMVKGYRADDSYFSFAEDFLNNTITVEHLSSAMELGNLGIQYVLVSQKAFDQLNFSTSIEVESNKYYPLHIARDTKARNLYKESSIAIDTAGQFVMDIIRGNKNGDTII